MNRSRSLRSHLTYANVMATIAVFIALGGSSYAAVKLNGKDIKKNTVAGKALKKDTLGGREIKESKLNKVPSAATADSALTALTASSAALASHATSADSVGGAAVTPINQVVTPAATPVVTDVYARGAIKITGSCSTGDDFPTFRFVSSANGGTVSTSYTTGGSTQAVTTFSGALNNGDSTSLNNGAITFVTHYSGTLRNADGKSASFILSGIKSSSVDGFKCRYTGVAFGV